MVAEGLVFVGEAFILGGDADVPVRGGVKVKLGAIESRNAFDEAAGDQMRLPVADGYAADGVHTGNSGFHALVDERMLLLHGEDAAVEEAEVYSGAVVYDHLVYCNFERVTCSDVSKKDAGDGVPRSVSAEGSGKKLRELEGGESGRRSTSFG